MNALGGYYVPQRYFYIDWQVYSMGKIQDRKNIVEEIKKAAKLYKQHLVGKRFLYVFEGQYIEVIYKAQNFRHLTGVNTRLSARQFYSYAVRDILEANQIGFNQIHPYNLCVKKIKHIKDIATLAGSESFMLEEITTATKMYKFGTTDLNFSICMNKETDEHGRETSECYVVESLRDEDCFSRSKSAYSVTHIFSRDNSAKKYTDLLFMDKSSSINDLPEAIQGMLSDALLTNDNDETADIRM